MSPTSESPCIVTILAPREDDTIWIRLVGALQMGAEPALTEAVDRVRDRAPRRVSIDLAGVTFAGALLAHLLTQLHAAAPRASIYLHHASPAAVFVLTATGVDKLVIRTRSVT